MWRKDIPIGTCHACNWLQGGSRLDAMKAAFTTWNNRIAPVFDVARTACIVEVAQDGLVSRRFETLGDDLPAQKVLCLVKWKIATLVCGAISRSLQSILTAQAIRVIPFVAGDLQEVIDAWLNGSMKMPLLPCRVMVGDAIATWAVLLPLARGAWGLNPEAKYRNAGGRGLGNPRGGGRAGVAGTGGGHDCVCPKCGQRGFHRRGVPCTMTQCRACGTAMVSVSYRNSKPRR